jgi:hypothetical protein
MLMTSGRWPLRKVAPLEAVIEFKRCRLNQIILQYLWYLVYRFLLRLC